MKLFLIRHGESIQNTKDNHKLLLPDPQVYLSQNGIIQARKLGIFLKNYILNENLDMENAVLWVSPFTRTRQTAQIINKEINIQNVKEDYALIEQRYGLFSDKSIETIKKSYPKEFNHYDNYYQNGCKFYAQLPQGEAPYDVAIRTRMFLDKIAKEENNPIFVVSHGTAIRTIVMNLFDYSPEWFDNEENMENCSVRLIDGKTDEYIYGGKIKKLVKNRKG